MDGVGSTASTPPLRQIKVRYFAFTVAAGLNGNCSFEFSYGTTQTGAAATTTDTHKEKARNVFEAWARAEENFKKKVQV